VIQESTGHDYVDKFTIDIIGTMTKEMRDIINFRIMTSDDESRTIREPHSSEELPRHFVVASGQANLKLSHNDGLEKAEYTLNVEHKITIPAHTEWTLELGPRTIILTFTYNDSYLFNVIPHDYK